MFVNSDISVPYVSRLFSKYGVRITFLAPTETAMHKSIIDAIEPLRIFLREAGVHDYDHQLQGERNKKRIRAYFVGARRLRSTQASLYRPVTKLGDPRIWFYKLKSYASANNLLVIFCINREIYVVNASNREILSTLDQPGSPLNDLIIKAIRE